MKFLFCINDDSKDNIPLTRIALKSLFEEYYEYNYKESINKYGSMERMELDLIHLINKIKPNIIHFNQLNDRYMLSKRFFKTCKKNHKNIILTQESVDAFHRVPKAMYKLVEHFDLTLTNCGNLEKEFNIKFPLKTFLFPEKISLFSSKTNNVIKDYDAIFIGSNNFSKKPWNFSTGVIDRLNIVYKLTKDKTINFAVFGNGWEKFDSNRGFLPFHNQIEIMQKSRLIIGANLYRNYDMYFSNRIPNSLVSGTPLVHRYSKGLDNFFKDNEHIFYYESIEEAKKLIKKLLSWPQERLDDIGSRARDLVLKKHTALKRYEYYLSLINAYKNGNLALVEPDFFFDDKY